MDDQELEQHDQQHQRANAEVLEESTEYRETPLIYAIYCEKNAIALWLIEHRGEHYLDTQDGDY